MPRIYPIAIRELGLFCLAAIATAIAVQWIDLPLARTIAGGLSHGPTRVVIQAQYPDLLDLLVAAVTLGSWFGYMILGYIPSWRRLANCLHLTGTAVPIAYAAKAITKNLCGRINTRFWLAYPAQYDFHWLHSGPNFSGFPSGHFAILIAFVLAIVYYYPRWRGLAILLLIACAAALVISEYHFLGDVIGGAYLGYLSYLAGSAGSLRRREPR
jgi:membrane-associated phospholipid phosphatase